MDNTMDKQKVQQLVDSIGASKQSDYQPVVDALFACNSGEFSQRTVTDHQALALWIRKYPHALADGAAVFLSLHIPESVADRLNFEDTH